MDFGWSPEQEDLHGKVAEFCRRELANRPASRPAPGLSPESWRACGDFGLLGLPVAVEHGGMGLGALSTAYAMEAFGRECLDSGLVFSVCAHLFGCVAPIAKFGANPDHVELVRGLCAGSLVGANAATEPEAGSDVHALKTRAVRSGDHYVLSGDKSFVTNGPEADVIVVYAVTDPRAGFLGLSAFAVDAASPGIEVGAPFDTVGLDSSPVSSVYFEDCHVPASRRIGAEGQGAAVFKYSMSWERSCLFAAWLGVMARQLDQTIAHAKGRKQFGKPIGDYQAVSHKIVRMAERLQAARLLVYKACWSIDRGQDATVAVSMAKLATSEAFIQSSLDALQIHGGAGVVSETGIERTLRDAVGGTIHSGTSEILREVIARHLGL